MARLLLSIVLATALAQGQEPPPREPGRHGTNYDPPPRYVPKPEPPPAPPEAEKPLFQFQDIDWGDKSNWVKLGLLVGSIVLARRAFRQMRGDY